MPFTDSPAESPIVLGPIPEKQASTKAFKKAARGSLWRSLRHPIRIAVMAVSAMALTWELVGAMGAVASGIAAGLGVFFGEMLGRGRLKLPVILGGAAVGLLGCWLLASLTTSTEIVASLVGPGEALAVAVVLRFGAFALWPVLALRAIAVRHASAMAAEVIAVAGATAVLFSAHRGGIISRPFWLSDWAWRAGLDPAHVLLAIGGITVVVLTALMIAETGRRITWLSALALPLTAALVLTFMDLSGLPKPRPDTELGLTDKSEKETAQDNSRPPPSMDVSGKPPPSAGPSSSSPDQSTSASPSASGSGQQPRPQPPQNPEDDSGTPDKSNAPLAVVLLGDDYSPPMQAFYFRQEVLSHYTGSRLVVPTRSGVDLDTVPDFPSRKTNVAEPPPKKDRKTIRADVALLVDHTRPFGLETPIQFEPRPNPNPQRFVRAYRFKALAMDVSYGNLIGRKPGNPEWEDDVRDYYLVPSSDPRFGELARKIVSTLPANKRDDPFLAALVIKRWMDKELIYSTKERHAGVPDPTADFLFGNRVGYCVHFAHSAVFMWRSLGIPARVGTGYMVSEDDRQGSSILVRSGDAHAWPELYLEGIGWVVLDIAAERNLDPQQPPTDKDLQRKLSELARQKPPKVDGPDDVDSEPIVASLPSLWLILLVIVVAALIVLYAIKIWRRVVPLFAGRRAMTRVGYRLALDLLTEVGLTRDYGEPREEFARRVHDKVPSFTELTEMHQAARWGDPRVDIEQRAEFSRDKWKDALKRLRRERKAVAKTATRVLSALNPATFVWSK